MPNRWYVIHTKPHKGDEVVRRIGLGVPEAEVFYPKVRSIKRGIEPLFPNYVFIFWDLEDLVCYNTIKYTRGVNRILGFDGLPIPISDEVVDVIKKRVSDTTPIEKITFRRGAPVKIRRGLLKDLEGVLERDVGPDGRVAVLLRIHEREVHAYLSCKDLALVA